MARANPAHKPERHACCPNASHLRPRAFKGKWEWVLLQCGARLPVIHCPWCSERLPNRKAAELKLVRGGG